ncbi:MAG: contact-dependent growth inhibition system immunity protein [Campylobacterales bacterium]
MLLNQDFFDISTMSWGGLTYGDPDVEPFYLPPDIDNTTLGSTVREALRRSKKISTEEFMKLYKSGIVQQKGKEQEKAIMKKYGYKTKKAMWQMMDSCNVTAYDDGQIEIKPLHQNSLTGYSGISNDGPEIINISSSVSDEELGAAIRKGFKWCTSIYGRI